MTGYSYLRDPAAIYRASRAAVEQATDLGGLPDDLRPLALRLVHACALPQIASDLAASPGAVTAGRAALAKGATILCDGRMTAEGIIRTRLPAANPILCALDDPQTAKIAARDATTRAAAAVDLWVPRLAGAIVAIGNAPTALFHLLEILAAGAPKPALILGFPIGFVGATESKDALIADTGDIPYITLRGRFGGSALAAAAVNALCGDELTNEAAP